MLRQEEIVGICKVFKARCLQELYHLKAKPSLFSKSVTSTSDIDDLVSRLEKAVEQIKPRKELRLLEEAGRLMLDACNVDAVRVNPETLQPVDSLVQDILRESSK